MTGLRLHIGGEEARAGWKILNVQAGLNVDFVGTCTDLSAFDDASVEEIYASHVLEHLSYTEELPQALKEFHRVLKPGGRLRVSVPDFEKLIRIFLLPEMTPQLRFHVMRMIFGGQMDPHDFHKVGLTGELLAAMLVNAGFSDLNQVESFGEFKDSSELAFGPNRISLNVVAWRR